MKFSIKLFVVRDKVFNSCSSFPSLFWNSFVPVQMHCAFHLRFKQISPFIRCDHLFLLKPPLSWFGSDTHTRLTHLNIIVYCIFRNKISPLFLYIKIIMGVYLSVRLLCVRASFIRLSWNFVQELLALAGRFLT